MLLKLLDWTEKGLEAGKGAQLTIDTHEDVQMAEGESSEVGLYPST